VTSLFIKYMYLDIVTVIIFQQVMGHFFGTSSETAIRVKKTDKFTIPSLYLRVLP